MLVLKTYGMNWLERFWGVTDSFVFRCAEGAVRAIEGTFHCITHPVETAQGIAFLYKASHPIEYPQESALLGEIVKAAYDKCRDEFVNGDANTRATMIGRVVGEFVVGLIGSKGITKATSALKSLNASGRFAGLMRYFVRGEKSADEIAAIMEGAADATIDVNNTVQAFLGEVESIRSSPFLTRALRREGNIGLAHCDVPGLSQYFPAHSKVSFSTDPGASYGFTLTKQSGWVFNTIEVGGYNRFIDTEAKIIEEIASQLGNTTATGAIKLFTEAPPCASCSSVIQQFRNKYLNIRLRIFDEFFIEW